MGESDNRNRSRVVIVTGMSGAGKSTVLKALEDLGFFCIDNLPVILLPSFLKYRSLDDSQSDKLALVMDLRQPSFLNKYQKIFRHLSKQGYHIEIIFIDASDDVLLQRYSETRRTHPLSLKGSILESIAIERDKLAVLREMADKVIDSTSLNVHQLKATVHRLFLIDQTKTKVLFVHLISFGFRWGVPVDADMIIDVRFLPNPYFVEKLKFLDGNDPRVRDYVLSTADAALFREKITDLLIYLLPLYEKEGKTRFTIAFGCTGGKHRSVAVVNALGANLAPLDYPLYISHRDIAKS